MMITDFKREVLGWAEDMKVEPNEIHIRGMTRKWASCSSRGRLTFSFELLNTTDNFRAKVIVHELLWRIALNSERKKAILRLEMRNSLH